MSMQLFGGSAGPLLFKGTDQQTYPYSYNSGAAQLLSETASFTLGATKTALILANIDANVPQGNGLHIAFLDGASTIYPINGGFADAVFEVPNSANESGHFSFFAWASLAAGTHQIKYQVQDAIVVGSNKIYSAQLIVLVF